MARYDTDDRTLYRRDYDRTDSGRDNDRQRYGRSRYDRNDDRYSDRDDDLRGARRNLRDEFEGYDREDGRTRWDYAGRGPEDNVRNYGRDRGLRESEDLSGQRRYGRGDDQNDRYNGGQYGRGRYDNDRSDESYLRDRYDRDYNRDYVRDFGDHNGYVGRYEDDDSGMYGGRGPHAGRGPEGYSRSPERMTDEVNERLTDDDRVDASGIQVTAENGEVTLTGTVDDRAQKRRAEDVAESVRGVDDVHNRLTIRRDES